jgi:RNase P/RNase MRP subunit p29
MHWPDIFFKARKPKPVSELPLPSKPAPESAKIASPDLQPPTIKPVPKDLPPQGAPTPTPTKTAGGTSTPRTLPATHGVVLRPPAGLASVASIPQDGGQPNSTAPEPSRATAPIKNIEQLMAEADPVQALRQTGNVHILKSPAAEPEKAKETKLTPDDPLPTKSAAKLTTAAPANASSKSGEKESDSPVPLKPAATPAPEPKVIPPSAPSLMPFGSIFRRKAKMTDVARIVLPPKREETETAHVASEPSPTVVPPAFPVVAMTARANPSSTSGQLLKNISQPLAGKSSPIEKSVTEQSKAEPRATIPGEGQDSSLSNHAQDKPLTGAVPQAEIAPEIKAADRVIDQSPQVVPPLEKAPEARQEPPPLADLPLPPIATGEVKPVEPPLVPIADPPKVDPQAHKPEPVSNTAPKVDPEAHKTEPVATPTPAAPLPVAPPSASTEISTREKREFHLANGERVAGVVLSETPEAIYIEHGTLGVLTIPRSNIAKHLVEIILINGDRIVGDIMAETADTLYIRHASLGMLTVPRAQRSTRVVEAILKDGDRILGEVLTETDTFTVIRSATLGTITVPHAKMAMLNRKIEQIELKALPPPAPEIKDKPLRSDGKN